jgi:multiple sugar transport system substrate-binding protein
MDHKSGLSRRALLRILGMSTVGVAVASCTPMPAQPQAPASSAGDAASTPGGEVIAEVGPYIARTDASGAVDFPNGWGGGRIPLMEEQIADFNRFFPDIQVTNSVHRTDDLETIHLTSIAAGTPSNAIMLRSDAIPFFVEQGALMALDDLAVRDELDVDAIFYKGEIDNRRWNGQLYGLPSVPGGNRHMLWWNKGLFDEVGLDPESPPATWQDLDEMADVVRAASDRLYLLEHNHTAGSHPPLLVWMSTNNGSYISDDLTQITFDSPEGVETLEWMVQFARRQAGSYERMAAAEARRMDSLEAANWAAGRYLTVTAGSPYFSQLADVAPDLEYGVTLLPYNATNAAAKSQTPAYAGWSYCIPTGSKDVDAAWEWIKYTTAGIGQFNFMAKQIRPSVVRQYNENPELSAGNPYWDVVIADLEANVPIPVMPTYTAIRDIMYDLTEAALFEKQSPADALAEGAVMAQRALDEWLATLGS